MRIRVVADRVPLLHHALYKLGLRFEVIADEEERRLDVVLFERVQNLRRVAVFKAGVERDVDLLFLRVADVERPVIFQVIARRVGDRRRALLLKAQPPVRDGGARLGSLPPAAGQGVNARAEQQNGGEQDRHKPPPEQSPDHPNDPFPEAL